MNTTKRLSKHPEVIASNKRMAALLALVPVKCYADCTPAEQMRFNNLSAELQAGRVLCRKLREEGWR